MNLYKAVRLLTARVLLVFLPATVTWAAETHLIPLTELRQRTVSASEERQASLSKLDRFFSTGAARQALQTVKLDGRQVQQAISLLSSEELARLASRADRIQADLAAGALSNQELTYIVIALATAVLVLIIVKAR
ncbi:MAG TPA: hypothetical protein VL285_05030 [Bryobacteraceae bacterium]|jgi:hypothetical protein|nr:hypothetical protein [Bryobacteraceae bacterium]